MFPLDDIVILRAMGASKRLGLGVEPFDWCFNPKPRNTRKLSEIIGRAISDVPSHVKEWAIIMRKAIALRNLEQVSVDVSTANIWLWYLFSLPDTLAPRSFYDVDREKHVNDGDEANLASSTTLVGFLTEYKDRLAKGYVDRLVSFLESCFVLISKNERWASQKTCPFDSKMDKIFDRDRGPRWRTPRPSLDLKAWEIIVRENRRNDYEFARTQAKGKHHYQVCRNGETAVETVFWPSVPMIIDLILTSIARHDAAQWVDSGEADELLVDCEKLEMIDNTSELAVKGRQEGVLHLFQFPSEQTKALGIFFNTDKIKPFHAVPYIDPELPRLIEEMRNLQLTFNPIREPTRAINNKGIANLESRKPWAYPLFREPGNLNALPPSDDKDQRYWKELLKHCQPIIESELGYPYPLFDIHGNCRFDLHSIRVAAVTNLLAMGFPPTLIQDLLGHASLSMTFHYAAIEGLGLHKALSAFFEKRREALISKLPTEPRAMKQLVEEAVHLDDVVEYEGVNLLRTYAETRNVMPDFFLHGICPGGNCNEGGPRVSPKSFGPVWRPRACSMCRFRVTGFTFLHGLRLRADSLIVEIKQCQEREAELNRKIEELESSGKNAAHLRPLVNAEATLRSNLFQEFAAEVRTIQMSLAKFHESKAPGSKADKALFAGNDDFDLSQIKVTLNQVHVLETVHKVVSSSELMPAAIPEIPAGADALRNNILLEILRNNNLDDLFIRLSAETSSAAFNLLGDLILSETTDPSKLQRLIQGDDKLESYPNITHQIEQNFYEKADKPSVEVKLKRARRIAHDT